MMKNSIYENLSHAAITAGQAGIPTTVASQATLSGALNTAYFLAGIVAVVVIIAAGLRYTTSQGNASEVSQAKNAILAATVGLVVVIMAFIITQFVLGAI